MSRHTVLLLLIGLCGCRSAGFSARPGLLDTALGPSLELLWTRHGGIEAWSRLRGVELQYVGEGEHGETRLHVLLPLESPNRLYVRSRADEDGDASETPTGWRPVDISGSRIESFDIDEDFALRSIRHLFHLPFLVANGDWTLRVPIGANVSASDPLREFELHPRDRGPLGPYLISLAEQHAMAEDPGRRLERVLYLSRHESAAGHGREVRFSDYATIDGVDVATTREHVGHRVADPAPPTHPFDPPGERLPAVVWRERLSEIRFLDAEEFAAALDLYADTPSP